MKKKFLFCILFVVVISLVPGIIKAEELDITDNTKELFKKIQLFSDSLTLINAEYVQPVKITDLVHGAIKGMMDTLDKYSKFLDEEQYQEITEETKGEFGGIGVEIGIRQKMLTVLKIMEDTPAEKAGLEELDRIVTIAGKSTEEQTLDESVNIMRGEPNTYLDLSAYREKNQELLDFKIKRALIQLKSIKDVKIIDGDIGYLRLAEFQERTAKDLKKVIKDFQKDNVTKLILDLRGNPGGLLDASVEVADLFLAQGALIVYTEGRDPNKKTDFRSKKEPLFTDIDIIILVDGGSASAAEILAGALKDNKKAILVGTTTFGKGSVQTVIPLQDGSGLRLTTAAYYTPSGKNLMDKGIVPDVVVKKKKIIKKQLSKDEDLKNTIFKEVRKLQSEELDQKENNKEDKEPEEYDNQLSVAIDILKGAEIFCKNKMDCDNSVNKIDIVQPNEKME